jgi:dipeptide/tripeptide permease
LSPTEEPQDKPSVIESFKILFGASRGYWLVNAANFGDGVAYFGVLALMTLFMEHNVGFSTRWSGVSIGLYTGAVTIFMALGGGVVSDRLGVRKALTACIVTLLVGRIVFVMAPGSGEWLIVAGMAWAGLFLMAAGEGVIQPALYSGIKEYTDKRTATLGYAFLYAIMNRGRRVCFTADSRVLGFELRGQGRRDRADRRHLRHVLVLHHRYRGDAGDQRAVLHP